MEDLNNTINKTDVMGTHIDLHLTVRDYIFFTNTHGIFRRIKHIYTIKQALKKNQRISAKQIIFSVEMYLI